LNTGTFQTQAKKPRSKMKSLILASLVLLTLPLLATEEYYQSRPYQIPKLETPIYGYVYPEISVPSCHAARNMNLAMWRKENKERILVEDAQNYKFHNHCKKIAEKEGAKLVDIGSINHNLANFTLSRVVLDPSNLSKISKFEKTKLGGKKIEKLFINYGHADDLSYMGTPVDELPDAKIRKSTFSVGRSKHVLPPEFDISGRPDWERSYYEEVSAKQSERVFTLDALEFRGTKVYIYNRFYNIPHYIKGHRNVTILIDKNEFSNENLEPSYYTWKNLNGDRIYAGFLGIPWHGSPLGGPNDPSKANMFKAGIICLKVNGKMYDYKLKNLSVESRNQAIKLLGKYTHIGKGYTQS